MPPGKGHCGGQLILPALATPSAAPHATDTVPAGAPVPRKLRKEESGGFAERRNPGSRQQQPRPHSEPVSYSFLPSKPQRHTDVKSDRPSSHVSNTAIDKLQTLKSGKAVNKKKVRHPRMGRVWSRAPGGSLRAGPKPPCSPGEPASPGKVLGPVFPSPPLHVIFQF